MKAGRHKSVVSKQPDVLRAQFRSTIKELQVLSGRLLSGTARLSSRKHRGHMCRNCRRPTANQSATEDLRNEGDGPDLCWGNCDYDDT